jgi:hypothetical protein
MRDQENPKEKYGNQPPSPPVLADEASVFRSYLIASEQVRRAHGVSRAGGKMHVSDQKALDALPEWKKQIVREVWVELSK